eukprot:1141827-Pelagomonas_calceolata.AAC.3
MQYCKQEDLLPCPAAAGWGGGGGKVLKWHFSGEGISLKVSSVQSVWLITSWSLEPGNQINVGQCAVRKDEQDGALHVQYRP